MVAALAFVPAALAIAPPTISPTSSMVPTLTASPTLSPTTGDTGTLFCYFYYASSSPEQAQIVDVIRTDLATQFGVSEASISQLTVNTTSEPPSGFNLGTYHTSVYFVMESSLSIVAQSTVATWADFVRTTLLSNDFSVHLAVSLNQNVLVSYTSVFAVPNERITATDAPTVVMLPTAEPTGTPTTAPSLLVSPIPTATDEVTIDLALYMSTSAPVNYARLQALKAAITSTLNVPGLVFHDFAFTSTLQSDSNFQWVPVQGTTLGNFFMVTLSDCRFIIPTCSDSDRVNFCPVVRFPCRHRLLISGGMGRERKFESWL
jgi:hypothetical protein